MNQTEIKSHERFRIGLLLALVGGFLDAYTYVTRGGVFANAQTGNIVLLALNAAQGSMKAAAYYMIPITAFALGVLVTEYIKKKCADGVLKRWEETVLILEIILLGITGILPKEVPDAIVNVMISFICSLQVNTFRKVREIPYASTMCTGNLRSGMEKLFRFLSEKDRAAGKHALHYFGIILAFMAGAGAGAFLSAQAGGKSVWICCVLLAVVCFMMKLEEKRKIFRKS